jgi:hypothetical protein
MVNNASTNAIHLSPQPAKISLTSLWFGILGVSLAWMSLELVSYVLITAICNADTPSTILAHTDTVWQSLLPINLLVALFALFATGVAVHNGRKACDKMSGSAHYLLEVGEGRTCFFAVFGLLTSIGFLVALVFSAVTFFLVPLCR